MRSTPKAASRRQAGAKRRWSQPKVVRRWRWWRRGSRIRARQSEAAARFLDLEDAGESPPSLSSSTESLDALCTQRRRPNRPSGLPPSWKPSWVRRRKSWWRRLRPLRWRLAAASGGAETASRLPRLPASPPSPPARAPGADASSPPSRPSSAENRTRWNESRGTDGGGAAAAVGTAGLFAGGADR